MIKTHMVDKVIEETEDIFCDICARSCKTPDNDYSYMKLEAHWGYDSDHDCKLWTAQVCEKCVIEQLSIVVNFKKVDHLQLDVYDEIFQGEAEQEEEPTEAMFKAAELLRKLYPDKKEEN